MKHRFRKLLQFLGRFIPGANKPTAVSAKGEAPQEEPVEPAAEGACEELKPYDPCTPYFRTIVEELLAHYGLSYRDMRLMLLDTDPEEGTDILTSEEEVYILGQLLAGLNDCRIYTNRPDFFADFAEHMLQDSGLVVEILSKRECIREKMRTGKKYDLILDFETSGGMEGIRAGERDIYIPIYKRAWLQGTNLDITVPIGYNTVIVKGVETKADKMLSDRLEREFYAE